MEKILESEIEQQSEFKHSVWWKIYFFFFVVLTMLGSVSLLTNPQVGVSEYIAIVTTIVVIVGLFGFIFLKPIYKPQFWLLVLIADIVFSIIYYFIANVDLRMGNSDTVYYVSNTISWLLTLPSYYALYLYSKPSDLAWKSVQ